MSIAGQRDLDRAGVPAAGQRSPALIAVVVGAVRSILMPLDRLVAVLPALSVKVAIAERSSPSPPDRAVRRAGRRGRTARRCRSSATVTSPVCQPRRVNAVPVSTGAVLSTLMPVTAAPALLPAASVAVPSADWSAPSPRVYAAGVDVDAGQRVGRREADGDVVVVPAGVVGCPVGRRSDRRVRSCRC